MVVARPFTPTGKIYLTLNSVGSKTTGIYTYDFATNAIAKYYAPDSTGSLTPHFMNDGTAKIIFSSNAPADPKKKTLSNLQIFSLDEMGTVKQLTTSTTTLKRHPSFTTALGELVYGAKSGSTALGANPNEFNIYTYKDDKETLVTSGSLPTLTPDGKSVVALRKDGLYLMSLTGSTTERIWALDHGGSALNLQFTVSPKGKYIAWSIPNDGFIYIMKVDSWAPFKGALASKIPTHAFWPVFSPNEEYLAFEEVDWTLPTPTNQHLVVFDLVTPQRKTVADLKSYNQLQMFMSEWR
jgi:WD40 repeat protein